MQYSSSCSNGAPEIPVIVCITILSVLNSVKVIIPGVVAAASPVHSYRQQEYNPCTSRSSDQVTMQEKSEALKPKSERCKT